MTSNQICEFNEAHSVFVCEVLFFRRAFRCNSFRLTLNQSLETYATEKGLDILKFYQKISIMLCSNNQSQSIQAENLFISSDGTSLQFDIPQHCILSHENVTYQVRLFHNRTHLIADPALLTFCKQDFVAMKEIQLQSLASSTSLQV